MKEVIAHIHKRLNMGIDEIAAELGIENERFQQILEGKIEPPLLVLEGLVTKFGIDAQWLLTGKSYKPQTQDIETNQDYEYIPMFDVEVSAGNGAAAYGVTDPAMHLAFRKDWLKSRGLFAKDLNCVVARGDSMEPTINSKDTLLVDTSKNNPRDGQIYVIRSSDVLWVKRIQRQIDGSLSLISDNPTYAPMQLNLDDHPDIQVIGQVVQISKDLT